MLVRSLDLDDISLSLSFKNKMFSKGKVIWKNTQHWIHGIYKNCKIYSEYSVQIIV